MIPFDTQRLTPLALDEAATKVPQTILHGGGLTKGQIDAIPLSRLTAWLARLFH
jgi:hypothetical protein